VGTGAVWAGDNNGGTMGFVHIAFLLGVLGFVLTVTFLGKFCGTISGRRFCV